MEVRWEFLIPFVSILVRMSSGNLEINSPLKYFSLLNNLKEPFSSAKSALAEYVSHIKVFKTFRVNLKPTVELYLYPHMVRQLARPVIPKPILLFCCASIFCLASG